MQSSPVHRSVPQSCDEITVVVSYHSISKTRCEKKVYSIAIYSQFMIS